MTDRASLGAPESPAKDPHVPVSRRERRKLELRARILETASGLFADQGFHETRVAEICVRADIAEKTFFNHFPTKLHLLREIAHAGIAQLLVEIEDLSNADLATRERLHQLFDTVAQHISEAGPKNRELVTELVHAISGDADERSDQVRRLHAAFARVVDVGLARGDVTRRHDVQTLAELILGAYYVLIFNYANLDEFPVRERAHAAARILADSLAPHTEETNGTT
ncbi:MAG: TetR/AcrR family transcriptional regulator [Myxococcales bacterium]|nr:MAG: TetR/AcrR family transcriptional regulator [Myxococcales bacterium]